MTLPLVATKLYIPSERPGVVARPRLLTRLESGGRRRLTLISAPAGFGKTTLLASWIARADDDGAIAWLSLDAADSDPTVFWTGVVAAVRGAVPGTGVEALELLSTSPAPADVVTALLNDVAGTSGEVWLVLDDYHLVGDPRVAEGMTFLVEHLPPHLHVVLSTRADPDLPLARWRARGELAEIRAVDLRFTSGETATYLGTATGARLSVEQVRVLEDRTEGWIAALQLAAISLQGRDDVAGFIAEFAGDDRYVVDFLVEEVLAHQSPPVRDFLLRSAVLDRFCAPLCDVVVGAGQAGRLLREIERANLFLVALDDRREWYRYHQLFSDVLRARLLAEHPDVVPVLHRRASLWYEQHELIEAAITHALKARDFGRAAFLVELAVPWVRRHRQESKVRSWLAALPDDIVQSRPVLSVFSAALAMVSGDLDVVVPRLDDAERALAAAADDGVSPWADTDELRTLPATIAIYRASVAQARGDVAGTARHAQTALALAGPQDHLARGGATGFLGLAAWAAGDVSQALETFGQAQASLHAAGNLVDELSGTVVLADLWRATGRPRKARALCDRALRLAEARGEPVARATAELHVALAELDIEAGELESARRHLEAAADLTPHKALTESVFRALVAKALLARADGDPAAALDHLDQAEQLYRPGFLPDVRPIPAMRARLQIWQGDLSAAGDWARERGVGVGDPADYLGEFNHLTLVRLVLAQHRVHPEGGSIVAVLALLDRLREAADASGRAGSLLEIRLLTALSLDAQGRRPQALAMVTHAWLLAPEPEASLRLFLDEGASMVDLLRAAVRDPGVGQHAQRLLATLAAAAAPSPASSSSTPFADPLSERELQVLGLLGSELGGPQIAAALFISRNTLRTHTKHIFIKLGVSSRLEAVARARERGLLAPTGR